MSNRRSVPALSLVFATLLIAGSAGLAFSATPIAPAPPDPRPLVDRMVTAYMQRTGTHAVAVSLYFHGRDYLLSYGADGRLPSRPATPDLIFGIGSWLSVLRVDQITGRVDSSSGGFPSILYIELALAPSDTRVVYAVVMQPVDVPQQALFRSTDQGVHGDYARLPDYWRRRQSSAQAY